MFWLFSRARAFSFNNKCVIVKYELKKTQLDAGHNIAPAIIHATNQSGCGYTRLWLAQVNTSVNHKMRAARIVKRNDNQSTKKKTQNKYGSVL